MQTDFAIIWMWGCIRNGVIVYDYDFEYISDILMDRKQYEMKMKRTVVK